MPLTTYLQNCTHDVAVAWEHVVITSPVECFTMAALCPLTPIRLAPLPWGVVEGEWIMWPVTNGY